MAASDPVGTARPDAVAPAEDTTGSRLDAVLDRMEGLLGAVDEMAPADRAVVLELLDHVDDLHRLALLRLGQQLPPAQVEDLRAAHPAVAWLWEAYGVGLDDRAVAVRAIDAVRPYLESHGGDVEVVSVDTGVVRVRMAGACRGCSASAITLQQGVEEALRSGYPDFVRLDVEDDPDAVAHPPPGQTLLQIGPRPPGA